MIRREPPPVTDAQFVRFVRGMVILTGALAFAVGLVAGFVAGLLVGQ